MFTQQELELITTPFGLLEIGAHKESEATDSVLLTTEAAHAMPTTRLCAMIFQVVKINIKLREPLWN